MTKFTTQDADAAYEQWGCNCGPGALAAILDLTLDEVHAHIRGFDEKKYTSPTMMLDALKSLNANFKRIGTDWPSYGLVRIQWHGPWMDVGVPIPARYRQTHWIGTCLREDDRGVFDINCMNNGSGWVSFWNWICVIVPHISANIKRANGVWSITHGVEIIK